MEIGKKMKNGQAEQNQGVTIDFACPKAYREVRRVAKVVRSIKHKNLTDF